MMIKQWTLRQVAIAAIALAAFMLVSCQRDSTVDSVVDMTVDIGGGITMDMVWIAPGTFTMGHDLPWVHTYTPFTMRRDDRPDWMTERQVTLTRGFYMGIHEVTQEQFQAVMGYNPSRFSTNPAPGETQARRPVETVSWYHAIAFANRLSILQGLEPVYTIAGISNTDADVWLFENVPTAWDDPRYDAWNAVTANWDANGFRLPTEAEWEHAARAGTTTQWSFGNNVANSGRHAWYHRNSDMMTREVGGRRPNPWGLYDMHGNVWEWVWDWSGAPGTDPETDPTGAVAGVNRVVRGGGWHNPSVLARSAFRYGFNPSDRSENIGFRLVRP